MIASRVTVIPFFLEQVCDGETISHYPIDKTGLTFGQLPYSFEEGVFNTFSWMYDQKLAKHMMVE